MLRWFEVLPHWNRSCRSNVLSHPLKVHWHWSTHSSTNPTTAGNQLLQAQCLNHCVTTHESGERSQSSQAYPETEGSELTTLTTDSHITVHWLPSQTLHFGVYSTQTWELLSKYKSENLWGEGGGGGHGPSLSETFEKLTFVKKEKKRPLCFLELIKPTLNYAKWQLMPFENKISFWVKKKKKRERERGHFASLK